MRISLLRQRMIDDMTARHISEKAQKDYIRCVKNLAAFIGRPPETATAEDLRLYRLHLVQSPLGASSVNSYMTALRFFFSITLDRYELRKPLFRVEQPRKLPTVLTQEEVARLLDAAPSAKYKAALSVAYGAGLRASEVLSLKVSDIDSARMLLRVEQGKGRKDRYAMLSPMLLDILREWYRIGRPQGWLFPGRDPVNPLTTRQLNRACHVAARLAGSTSASRRIRCGTIYLARLCRVALERNYKRLRNKEVSCRSIRATRHSQRDLQAVQELQQIVVRPEAGCFAGIWGRLCQRRLLHR